MIIVIPTNHGFSDGGSSNCFEIDITKFRVLENGEQPTPDEFLKTVYVQGTLKYLAFTTSIEPL